MRSSGIIDLHCDTLTAFHDSTGMTNSLDHPKAMWSLSNLPKGKNWAQCVAIYLPDTLSQEEAIAYYDQSQRSFVRQTQLFCSRSAQCRTGEEIEQAWAQGKTALILTVENGSVLAGDMQRVGLLARDGVKMMSLTWNGENEIGSGNVTDHGLSAFGKEVIPALERCNIIADTSHLNDAGMEDFLAIATKPFVASHSNARAICNHSRNLTDEHIKEMVKRKCLIGLNYCIRFLREGGIGVELSDFLAHIEHFLALGAQDCLALGSDFDGTDVPEFAKSPQAIAELEQLLLSHGISQEICEKLFYKNALTFFKNNLRKMQ